MFEACPVVGQPPCLQIDFLFFDGEPLLFKGDFFGFLSPDGRLVQSLADVLDSLPKDATNFDVHADCRKSQPAQRERKRKRRAGNGREGNPKGGNKTTAAGQHVPRREVVPVEDRSVVVCVRSPAHLPRRLFCTNVLGMLPANCQDKSLPTPSLLLGRGGEFEKDLVKDPPVFVVPRQPNLVCYRPSHCSDR